VFEVGPTGPTRVTTSRALRLDPSDSSTRVTVTPLLSLGFGELVCPGGDDAGLVREDHCLDAVS
jgi:hypothetical protein